MKNKRHEALLEYIRDNVVSTQEELTDALNGMGFGVTQSTVSRDIKALRIVKTRNSDGRYRYVSILDNSMRDGDNAEKYAEIFSHSAVSVRCAMNDVVVRCYAGMASSACVAVDSLYSDMIVGSLAGDDTVFIITENESVAQKLTDALKKLF